MTIYYMSMCQLYPPCCVNYMYCTHFQDGNTPLHTAAWNGHTTRACVERLLSTPGIDVNIQNKVSWLFNNDMHGAEHYPVYGW